MQYKKGSCFSFNLGWYSIRLDIAHYEQGGVCVGGVFKGQNPHSVNMALISKFFEFWQFSFGLVSIHLEWSKVTR